jgi:gamma-glutamyltranspeptidase/glutathione hydrolase
MLKFSASSVTDPELRSVFYPKGRPAAFSALVKNPKLAATLERIAAEGPPALYQGGVAADIVDAIRRVGGPMTLEDVERYAPVERDPLRVEFEGYTVYTMPLPSAGGLMLVQTLKLFTAAELEKLRFGSGAYQHMVAEALRAAIADRMRYLGDPAFQPVAMDRLLSDARMAARRRSIALDRTHAIPRFGLEEHGTHHLVTADAAGNVVSLTTTVNRAFGAKLVAPQSGIVLNDELNDFTQRSAVAPLGMTQSPNRPRPGARPVSSMTPTIVTRGGRAVLALGGSGGPAIATNVTQVALSSLVFDHAPDQAVREPRFYVPDSGAFMLLEDGASAALFADLRRRGEIVKTMPFKGTAVQIIGRLNDRWLPAADPRKHGAALAE